MTPRASDDARNRLAVRRRVAGFEIPYTCHGNALPDPGYPDRPPRNANAANLAGLSARIVYPPKVHPEDRTGLFVDTLKVVLTIPESVPPSDEQLPRDVELLDPVVGPTVECLLRNGRISHDEWPYARYLDLRIEGPERFVGLGRVVDFAAEAEVGPGR